MPDDCITMYCRECNWYGCIHGSAPWAHGTCIDCMLPLVRVDRTPKSNFFYWYGHPAASVHEDILTMDRDRRN